MKKKRKQGKKKSSSPKTSLVGRVLFRPQRSAYVKKTDPEAKSGLCVFCRSQVGASSLANLRVHLSEHSQIVLNKFPYNSGHLLILPRRHCGDLLSLSPVEYEDLYKTLRLAVDAVTQVQGPEGINLGLNQGRAAGAGLPDHLHFHLVPRWGGDLNFFPLIAETKVVIETLEQTYSRYLEYFSKV